MKLVFEYIAPQFFVKKLFSTIFILVFCFSIGGYLLMFELLRFNCYFETNNVDINRLTVLKLSFNEFKNLQTRQNEFRFQGKMYDVVTMVLQNDSVVLTCVHDENEDELFQFLESVFESHTTTTTSSNHFSLLIAKIISLQFLLPEAIREQHFFSVVQLSSITTYSLLTVFLSKETPPPKFCNNDI
jgi:hypothetical protein